MGIDQDWRIYRKMSMKIVGIGDLLIPAQYILEGLKSLEKKGCTVEVIQWNLKDYEELQNINLRVEKEGAEAYQSDVSMIDKLKDADFIVTQFFPINKIIMDKCPKLKMIGVLRGGVENVNVDYATQKDILVFNTPGRNANAVADFTVGMLIAECRNIARSHKNLMQVHWVRDYMNAGRVPDLSDKTVGLIGLGAIGKKVAQRLNGFEMNILAYDSYAKEVPEYVKMCTLEDLLKKSDFVSMHCRLTKDNYHLMDKNKFDLMKETAYFINTARSGLVNEQDLYDALRNNKILGAAIDVFDEEPLSKNNPFLTLPNVTITPHLAGGTSDAFLNSPKLLAKEVLAYIDERIDSFIINK